MTQQASTSASAPTAAELEPPRARSWTERLGDLVDRNVFVILVLAAAGLFRVALLGIGIGSDTWYTLLGGRIVSRSWLPHGDTLTVLTQGKDWVDAQWLAHLLFYGLWTVGGWPLALLVLLATYLGAFAIAAATARRLGASGRTTAMVGVVCLVLAMGESTFRAQTLAYVLFALVVLLLLDDTVRPSSRVYLTLPILALWANVHGSVVLGAALVALRGLTAAFERGRPLPRAGVLIVAPWLCTLASPYALSLPSYYARLLHNPALSRFVSEWQPASVKNEPLFFILLLGALLLVARAGSVTVFARVALLATAVGGLLAVRHVVWFALAAAAVLPSALDDLWHPEEAPRRRRLNLMIAGAAAGALAVAVAAYAAHSTSWFERGFPARAGAAVAVAASRDPSAKVFANERYADWLLFEQPELDGRIAYDVRFELLSQRQLTGIARFRLEQGAHWLRAADGYRILVLDPDSDKGAVALLRERGARTLYRNREVVVLERA